MSDVTALKQLLSLAADPKKLEAELTRIETAKTQLNEKLKTVRDECEALKAEAAKRDEESKARELAVAQKEDQVYRREQKLLKDAENFEIIRRNHTAAHMKREAELKVGEEKLEAEKADHAAKSEAYRNASTEQEKKLARRNKEADQREEVLSQREAELAAAVNAYENRARRLREALE